MSKKIPKILGEISLDGMTRIDLGLEGAWSESVQCIWTRENGLQEINTSVYKHPQFKAALELYYNDVWVGIHCFKQERGENIFDQEFAKTIIDFIEQEIEQGSN